MAITFDVKLTARQVKHLCAIAKVKDAAFASRVLEMAVTEAIEVYHRAGHEQIRELLRNQKQEQSREQIQEPEKVPVERESEFLFLHIIPEQMHALETSMYHIVEALLSLDSLHYDVRNSLSWPTKEGRSTGVWDLLATAYFECKETYDGLEIFKPEKKPGRPKNLRFEKLVESLTGAFLVVYSKKTSGGPGSSFHDDLQSFLESCLQVALGTNFSMGMNPDDFAWKRYVGPAIRRAKKNLPHLEREWRSRLSVVAPPRIKG